jgi:hypothetical protein
LVVFGRLTVVATAWDKETGLRITVNHGCLHQHGCNVNSLYLQLFITALQAQQNISV